MNLTAQISDSSDSYDFFKFHVKVEILEGKPRYHIDVVIKRLEIVLGQ